MREIKFKLWHKPTKQMYYYEPTWGNYGHGGGWIGAVLEVDYLKHGRTFAPSNQMQLEPESCEWLQFTGLLDKNGKEIYEGDIVELYKYQGEALYCRTLTTIVKWNETGLNFNIWLPQDEQEFWKVIGNIYENPELIKGGSCLNHQ